MRFPIRFGHGARLFALAVAVGVCLTASGARAQTAVPPELAPWQAWALHGEEARLCPWLAPNTAARQCAWAGVLRLEADARGARFTQRWQADAETWLPLPGDVEHWPEAVTLDGRAVAVVESPVGPAVRVPRGSYLLAGRIQWANRPESLAIPRQAGLVALTVDGRAIAAPGRDGERLQLGARAASTERDALRVEVHRLLADDQPALLTTRVRLEVAGEAREVTLAGALPATYTPVRIDGELPARLERGGRVRVQVRPGSYHVDVVARAPGAADTIAVPAAVAPWPAQEIWSFRANDRLRVAGLDGLASIDPAQAGVPDEWRELPAYAVAAGSALRIVERSRALAASDANELTLRRTLWRDFDGGGYTVLDQIGGRLQQGWRLDARAPFAMASARERDDDLLVTKGATDGATGVELRSPQLQLRTLLRAPGAGGMPATGYAERFTDVQGELRLAPGLRLFAALGTDAAPDAWLERWHLIDLFIVLLVAVAALRLAGLRLALLALAALVLTYHEGGAPTWLWVNLLIALALASVAPEGRLRRLARGWRLIAFALVLIALLPFCVMQARYALYPQLALEYGAGAGLLDSGLAIARRLEAAAPAPAPAEQDASVADSPAATNAAVAIAPGAPPSAEMAVAAPSRVDGSLARKSATRAASRLDEALVASERRAYGSLERYASGALVQAGPGIPGWSYQSYPYRWSGPVEADERVRFVILPRPLVSLWRLLGLALSIALLAACAAFAWSRFERVRPWLLGGGRGRDDRGGDRGGPGEGGSGGAARAAATSGSRAPVAFALLAALATLATLGIAPDARAAGTPDPALLQELRNRLLEAPRCAPICVGINAARATVVRERLEIVLEVGALERVAIPLPSADPAFQPDSVTVDGEAGVGLHRDAGGQRWLALARGVHRVVVAGPLAGAETLKLAFPLAPRRIDVSAEGWDVAGLLDRRLVSGALELARRRVAEHADAAHAPAAGGEFPPFVVVRRQFRFALDWSVATEVERVAPANGAFTVRVPLIAGEAPLTPGLNVREGRVDVGLASGEDQRSWQSALARDAALALVGPDDPSRTEVWSFEVGEMWHAEFTGLAPVAPEADGERWVSEYYPRANEKLSVAITRPAAIAGSTLAFDSATFVVRAGRRSRTVEFQLGYRATQGGRHVLKLPADARVTRVMQDGEPVPVRPERGELALALLPGNHAIHVAWETAEGGGAWLRAPQLLVGAPVANVRVTLVPEDRRWVLLSGGPGLGPAVLYWGELVVFALLAIWLGRSGLTPLGVREWLLLGLGLSTFSWAALAVVAAWLIAFRLRERATAVLPDRRYELRQIGLAFAAIAGLVALVSAIPAGLLAQPDMRIAYPPGAHGFAWFVDRTQDALPRPWTISLSLWWYKAAMLAWALWLSFALARWVRWAWAVYSSTEPWRSKSPTASSAAQ